MNKSAVFLITSPLLIPAKIYFHNITFRHPSGQWSISNNGAGKSTLI